MLYYKTNIVPNSKPYRIRLDNGTTITDPTHEQLLENGWLLAPDRPNYTYPQSIIWVEPYWVVREPNEEEINNQWASVKEKCVTLLAATDYKVLKAVESAAINSTTLSQELELKYINYRQAIRDIYNNVNNLNPFFIDWPVLEETSNGS